MEFTLKLPEKIYLYETEMWDKFFESMQMALNRMAVGYMKYHAERDEKFMECEEDKVTFIRQRLAMYSGMVNNDACDCDANGALLLKTHSPSCFIRLHYKKINSKNTENLLDVANGCFCEFIRPNLEGAFFRSQSSEESPGLVRK